MRQDAEREPPNLIVTDPNATANEALKIMMNFEIHHLLILQDDRLAGIISDRDIFSYLYAKGENTGLSKLSVFEIMRKDVPVIKESTSMSEALSLMVEWELSALPIMKNGQISGIVTESDLLKAFQRVLQQKTPFKNAVHQGEAILADPVTRSLVSVLSELGL